MMITRAIPLHLLLFLTLPLAGCGPSTGQRLSISGQVTLKGAALDQGTISFRSTDGKSAGALIRHGAYSIPAVSGLAPGTYRVEISSPEGAEVSEADYAAGKAPLTTKDRIPAEYNTASKLTVEVTAGAANRHDFDL